MLFRERLEHQDKKCDLCSKRNQVLWAGSGGELSFSITGRGSRITVSVVIILTHFFNFEGDCVLVWVVPEHRNPFSGIGMPLWSTCYKTIQFIGVIMYHSKSCWSVSLLSPACVDKLNLVWISQSTIAVVFQPKWNLPEKYFCHLHSLWTKQWASCSVTSWAVTTGTLELWQH